jgi:hypothetical protein
MQARGEEAVKTLLLFLHFFVPTQKCLDDFHARHQKVCDMGECWWVNNSGSVFTASAWEPMEHYKITTSSVASKDDCYDVFTSTLPAAKPEAKGK